MRRQIGGKPNYFNLKEMEAGMHMVTGFFRGWVKGDWGDQVIIESTLDGKTYRLPHTGNLTKTFTHDAVEGKLYEVTYQGTEIMKKGTKAGKMAHQFDVFEVTGKDAGLEEEEKEEDVVEDEVVEEKKEESSLDEFENF